MGGCGSWIQPRRRVRGHPIPCAGHESLPLGLGCQLPETLAVLRYLGIEEDQAGNAARHPVRHPERHHAAVAVRAQDHLVEVLVLQHVDHVLDVGVEVGGRCRQVAPFPEAGQRHRHGLVPSTVESVHHRSEPPPTVVAARNDHVGRHVPHRRAGRRQSDSPQLRAPLSGTPTGLTTGRARDGDTCRQGCGHSPASATAPIDPSTFGGSSELVTVSSEPRRGVLVPAGDVRARSRTSR